MFVSCMVYVSDVFQRMKWCFKRIIDESLLFLFCTAKLKCELLKTSFRFFCILWVLRFAAFYQNTQIRSKQIGQCPFCTWNHWWLEVCLLHWVWQKIDKRKVQWSDSVDWTSWDSCALFNLWSRTTKWKSCQESWGNQWQTLLYKSNGSNQKCLLAVWSCSPLQIIQEQHCWSCDNACRWQNILQERLCWIDWPLQRARNGCWQLLERFDGHLCLVR